MAPFERLIGDYLQEKRATGASPKTIQVYGYALEEVMLPACRAVGVNEPSQLTNRHLNDLVIGLLDGTRSRSGRPLAKPSVNSYTRAINAFLAWASTQGEAITAKAQRPKPGKRVLDVLSREEIRAMEDAASDERDKLIVRILADSGIRLGELLKLTAADLLLDGRKNYLKIHGKGDTQRKVPIQPALALRLNRYVQRTRKESRSSLIFLTSRRRASTGEYEPLTDSGTQQMVRNLAVSAGLTKRVYPHLFRHSFVTEQLRRGISPILLAQIVGHSSLTMINEVYQHLNQ
ncbi:MAG TPA: site-specific integrase, partial [Candidatus Dormibacteraeota bacterium]